MFTNFMPWPTKKLGEIAQLRMGETLIKKDLTGDGMPVYSADSLEKPWGYTSKNKLRFHSGVIVIGARGTIGSLKLPEDKYFTSTQTTIVVESNKKEVLSGFLFYFLNTLDFKKFTAGTGIPMITVGYLNTIKIPIPLLKIQRKIVERLDAIKKAQELNDKQIQLVEELFQSLLHRELNPKGKNWEEKKLKEVGNIISGGTPSRKKPEYFGGKIPWVKSGELKDVAIFQTEEHITREGLKNSSAKLLPVNTILIAMYGATVGKTGILKISATTNQAIASIQVNQKMADFNFIYFILRTKIDFLLSRRFGGAQPNINQSVIKNLKIPLPPIKTQRKIVEKLSAAQEYKKKLTRQRELLRELFESTLNKLMKNQS